MCAHSPRRSQLRLLLMMPNHHQVRKAAELGFRIWSVWDPSRIEADFAPRAVPVGFFLLPEGQLETYTGTEDIAVTPWVRGARFPYAAGDWIAPVGDPRARRAYVVVGGDTPELTRERAAKARQDLVADIRPAGR